MGRIVRPDARVDRIVDVIERSNVRAAVRGGEVAAAAASRMSALLVAIPAAKVAQARTAAVLTAAVAARLVAEDTARRELGLVWAEMWTAVGRPAHHERLQAVFLGGLKMYNDAPRPMKPELLRLVVARLTAVSAPPWTDAQRSVWAARIDAVRAPLAAAVSAEQDARLLHRIEWASFAAKAGAGLRALVAFKRDCKYLGLTEGQIHEIIPDDTPRRVTSGEAAPAPSNLDTGEEAGATDGAVAPPLPALADSGANGQRRGDDANSVEPTMVPAAS